MFSSISYFNSTSVKIKYQERIEKRARSKKWDASREDFQETKVDEKNPAATKEAA